MCVDELLKHARDLAEDRPSRCRWRRIGASRAGEPMGMLSVGRGSRAVLVVAGAHANETAAGVAALALARYVADAPEWTEGLDLTWHFVMCLDPDSARLHTVAPHADGQFFAYHRGFFRPVGHEQPELAPSIRAPGDVLPESQALISVIEELRPVVQISLHGIDVGGTWVQVTREIPGLAGPLAESADACGIPVERASFDTFFWPEAEPGVFVMPPPGEKERFDSHAEDAAASTWYLPNRLGGATALIEVPMWTSALVADLGVHPGAVDAVRTCVARLRERGGATARLLAGVSPRVPRGRVLEAAQVMSDLCPVLADDWCALAADCAAGALPPLTRAHITAIEAHSRRLPLRAAAMLLHHVEREGTGREGAGRGDAGGGVGAGVARGDARGAALRELHAETLGLVARWCDEHRSALRGRWLPVAQQVQHQANTALAVASLVAGAA
ncbi:3-hydroxyacyl-CoA dehydrogenase [Yinghuangia sp. KLBMP8922]|uniref:3-hydroxyacyl-CoA dehydrogenase n=1 Tax=Yinghuangia soli TaxID=2908204 RepID=A0AA41Q5J4_9ACTN|nr:M14 family zinc carboxypeptidase [Yinghuangia soli]MCF2531953.1 3-hydroxyacyl-CoA dehydrogenase [Yinghuangia soli]